MRTAALVTAFVVLAGVFCRSAVSGPKWPKESTGPLTETDIAQFIKLVPTLNAALAAGGWTTPTPKTGEAIDVWLVNFVNGMNAVPGVDESLATAGSSWSKMRAIMFRVIPAVHAVTVDKTATPELIEQLRKDTTAVNQQYLKNLEEAKAALAKIPSANRELVSKYMQKLMAMQIRGR
jgi:hypothetical protein